jgi:hypothetical protein
LRLGHAFLITALGLTLGSCITGNDTGGIMPWSAETELNALDMAQSHCARFNNYAVITSVHREYGDYIAFRCQWKEPTRPRPISTIR